MQEVFKSCIYTLILMFNFTAVPCLGCVQRLCLKIWKGASGNQVGNILTSVFWQRCWSLLMGFFQTNIEFVKWWAEETLEKTASEQHEKQQQQHELWRYNNGNVHLNHWKIKKVEIVTNAPHVDAIIRGNVTYWVAPMPLILKMLQYWYYVFHCRFATVWHLGK